LEPVERTRTALKNVVTPKHILATFDEARTDLRNDLLTMAGLTERSLYHAINGWLQRDDTLCTKAIVDDEEVDQLEKQIDKARLEILLRYQPVASDLRQVISAIKLSPNIERVADEATNIAECARKLNGHPSLAEVKVIVPIQAHAYRCSRTASTHLYEKTSSWHGRS
jgi:phosphate transport system protein